MPNQKAPKLRRNGASRNIQNTPIVSEYQANVKQITSSFNHLSSKFLTAIKQQKLTEALEFLENIGIAGDLASFTIKHFNSFIRGYES